MHTQSIRSQTLAQLLKLSRKLPSMSDVAGRLIRIVLALYLIPVLLVVLIIGGTGCLVLTVGRFISVAIPIQRTVD